MDVSDSQSKADIMQGEGKSLNFCSQKLTSVQRSYTTREKALLSIVETLNKFRSILFEYSSQCAQLLQGLVQEFNSALKFIAGKAN